MWRRVILRRVDAVRDLSAAAAARSLGKAAEEQENGDGQRDQTHEPQLESHRTTSGVDVPGLPAAILVSTGSHVCPATFAASCGGIPYPIPGGSEDGDREADERRQSTRDDERECQNGHVELESSRCPVVPLHDAPSSW